MEYLELLVQFPVVLYVLAFAFGALTGSFLNVVILRLPARMEHDWRGQCRVLLELPEEEEEPPPGIVRPPSRCPKCKRHLKAYHNIPILGWLLLRGKCAFCKKKISVQYPLVELLTAILFTVVVWHFGATMQALLGCILTATLIAASGIDVRHHLLPDNLVLPLLWLGLLVNTQIVFSTPTDAIFGAAVGYLSLWLVYQVFKLLTGREGMGYGDFKLLAAFGAWFGWQSILAIVLLSSVVGLVVGGGVLLLKSKDRRTPIPFGPYLAGAGWIYLLWGEQIVAMWLASSGM